ncbi:MAG: CBS domain-containing protein [Methanoregula sp.]|uniref:CBS domain-containing protein n=1 Tax=Methanoregula sp. TaxID=2052170 RepID=UPI0025D70341|nr:CBS domain-containing protein [Methanoregula sp.]MCK9631715.1 CBS domain-containing protein [Methanoregula sp.]
MYARDVMVSPLFVVDPNATVAHARNLMVRHKISRLPVMEGVNLVGIITKKDIAYRLRQGEPAWRRRPPDRIPVGALMTKGPVMVAPDTGVREIARMFVKKNISSVPVVDEGVMTGIVTKTDLMKSALIRALSCPVGGVMEDVATVSRYHSLDHVVGVMRERNDKVLVTEDDGTLAGIITETNLAFYEDEPKISGVVGKDVTIRRRETADGPGGQGLMVIPPVAAEDLMTSPVITVTADTLLPDAIALMEKHHVNSLVVMEDSTISGIVKRDDIIKEVAK